MAKKNDAGKAREWPGPTGTIRRNYDYGEGLWENMDKYDSVEDFVDEQRKENLKTRKEASEHRAILFLAIGDKF